MTSVEHPVENVWDYPRPPAIEPSDEHVVVELGGVVVADTHTSFRILETTHPPTYYLPRSSFTDGALRAADGQSFCEWKGLASYLDIVSGDVVAPGVAWFYPEPSSRYAELVDHVALYPGRVDRCTVDDEVVRPQPGGFYGGWITSRVRGPFKGDPGTMHW